MLRKLFSAVLLTASVAFAAQAATPPPQVGRLSVRGAEILDPSGQPILLRGWNWGHWGSAQAQDAADNAAQGANVVRIPLRWWGFYKGRGGTVDSREDAAAATAGIDPDNLRHLDEMVRWASSAKLWIILFVDSDCGQNGTQDAQERKYCDPQGRFAKGRNFWTDTEARQRFLNVWRFVAARYKDTPYLGMFEPLPEPNPPGVSPEQINAFYDETMQAIRQVAPGVPFLVGGRSYRAPAIRDAFNPAWKDVVYTGNLFLHAKKSGGGEAAVADSASAPSSCWPCETSTRCRCSCSRSACAPVRTQTSGWSGACCSTWCNNASASPTGNTAALPTRVSTACITSAATNGWPSAIGSTP
jgi:aryl-phospho-beta-D-glucosidase BglC (GH1 family)